MKLVSLVILLLSFHLIKAEDLNLCDGIIYGNLSHPDPQNCRQYIFCMMTFTNLRSCPPNTVFVPHPNASYHAGECQPGQFDELALKVLLKCLYDLKFSTNVGDPETCEVFTITTPIDSTTEFEYSTETLEDETDTTTDPEYTTDLLTNESTTTSRPPTTTPVPVHRCPPGGFGYIPHHTNCNRYFECIRGVRHLRFCPEGLLFDSVTLQCTYPDLAVCAGYQ